MLGKDANKKITEHLKHRRVEKQGRSIYIVLKNGDKVFGELVRHKPNVLEVRDRRNGIVKELHRAIMVRFMVVIDGGGGQEDGEGEQSTTTSGSATK